jgi:hypothetical protein
MNERDNTAGGQERMKGDPNCPLCLGTGKINPIQDNPMGEVDPCPNCLPSPPVPGLKAFREWSANRVAKESHSDD